MSVSLNPLSANPQPERKSEPFKILVTGFEPFNHETLNPSARILEQLPAQHAGVSIHTLLLPVSFEKAPARLVHAIDALHPDAVLCLGQAGGRASLSLERIGINLMEASIADNDGFLPDGQPVIPDGAAAYFSTLPLKSLKEALAAAGIPCLLSASAGTYVCNCLLYSLMHHLSFINENRADPVLGGFVHVPWLPEQTVDRPQQPSMPLSLMTEGILTILAGLAPSECGDQKNV